MQLIIKKTPTFNVKQTLDCGQVFRYVENEGVFTLFAGTHRSIITDCGDNYLIECDNGEFFQKYLDFDTNYDIIQLKSQDKGLISSAIEYGKGIHLLRQDTFEALISFLVSQNNHIPRIKAIIERLSLALGEDMGGYHAFPTAEAMANKAVDWYAAQGAGYRAEYLALAARRIAEQGMPDFASMDTEEARSVLLNFKGVGRKVADCVLLFGLSRYDVFPVDTWILKAFEDQYPGVNAESLSKQLVTRYGELSGFVQQWLYYFKREQKKV